METMNKKIQKKIEEIVEEFNQIKASNTFFGDEEAKEKADLLNEVFDRFRPFLEEWFRKELESLVEMSIREGVKAERQGYTKKTK